MSFDCDESLIMTKNATVAIQLDACRSDYISKEDTPFLFSLKQVGISGSLVPTFGFEPDAAYLAGLWPDQCNGGMHFWYSPETSPFREIQLLVRYLGIFPNTCQNVFRRILSKYVQKTTNYSRPRFVTSIGKIPFRLIPYFEMPEKALFYEDKFANGRNIFTILKNNNKSFFFHGAPTCPTGVEDVYRGLVEANHTFDFIFLHTGMLDGIGHKYGPHSDEISSALRRLDRVMKEICTFLKNKYEEFNLVIFGDHGMVEVKETLDIERIINGLGLKLGDDYIYFLDSTIARFWFFNENARGLIISVLSEIKQGSVLTEKDKSKYHLHYSHNKFGDLLFLVAPGTLIFPNFWNNTTPEKGMHGYEPEYNGQQSALVIHSPFINKQTKIEHPIDMRRIFPTLIKFTGMNTYTDNELSSIV